MRILILEDDPLTAFELQIILEDCGHEVAHCGTVAGARDAIADPPDFAFLDIDLPDGKSFEVADALHTASVPFVFVSASRRSDLPQQLSHAAFVAKPFEPLAIHLSLDAVAAA